VGVGDQVQTGDVLAILLIDKSPTEQAAEIASAELELLRAQDNLDQLQQNAHCATLKICRTLNLNWLSLSRLSTRRNKRLKTLR